MRSRNNDNGIWIAMTAAVLTLALVLTVVIAAKPLLASGTTNSTNTTSATITNVTATNVTTCNQGLLTAIQANLYIDDMWLMRVGANMSGFNATSLNTALVNATFTGFNITRVNVTGLPSLNLTPATLQNITNYFISKGECLLALQFLVHLRHYLVHEYVLERHTEILNKTLTYRLMLLNETLTRLEEQGLLNSTESSEIYSILSQLRQALITGNYSEAEALLSEYNSLISNITSQYYEEQRIGFANRVDHELEHFIRQIIRESVTLNETLMELGVLDHELGLLTNVTGLNITSVKELHEFYKELFGLYQMIQGNETAQIQLLQMLKHGKGFSDWLNTTQQFTQEAKGWQKHTHGKGSHGHGSGRGNGMGNGGGNGS